MSVLASDAFTRANAANLGGNWTTHTGVYNILSNQAQADPTNDARATYSAITWPDNHYSQAVITTGETSSSSDEGAGVCVRAGSNFGYRLVASTGATGNIGLSKRVSNTYTLVWTRTSSFSNGNTLYLEAQGTTIIAKNNGSAVGASTTDSAVSSGSAGLEYSSTEETPGANRADDWEGGDFGTPQYGRPNGDVTVGNWTTDTGGTTDLYAAIDETSASDSDYIRSPVGPSSEAVEVELSAPLDPLDSTGHTVRVRGLVDASGGGATTLTTELRQFGSALSTAASWDDTLTTSAQTFEHALTTGQTDAITDYSALRYRFTATQAAAPTPTLVAAGTAAFTATNAATIAPGLPAGFAADDIHILLAHRSDNTAMTSLSGWTQIAALSGNNTSAQRVEVWWRRAVGGDTAPTVTFGSGTVVRGARIIGIRGCRTSTDPFDTGAGAPTRSDNSTADLTVEFTDLTTQGANRFLLALGAFEDDPTTVTTMTNWTQPGGAVSASSLGNDMMLFYEHRSLTSAGSSGTAQVTVSGGTIGNSPSVGIVIALLGENTQRARVTWAELQTPQAAVAQDVPELYGRINGSLQNARLMHQLLVT